VIKHICQDIDPEDREHIYEVQVAFIVYLDPDNLPPEDSDEYREIAAEHVVEFVNQNPHEVADFIDTIELIECRSLRLITKE
jgi:hypothetical protein